TDNPEEDNTVAQVFQKGYRLKGVLLRPARVVVRKHG
ncbi:nucleotide exchange factor GrpE, partial [Longimicrobium sp.]